MNNQKAIVDHNSPALCSSTTPFPHPIPFAANALQCIANETSKTAPSPWDFVTLPEENRATAIGNMHRKIGKDGACGSGDILSDRQTNTHRQTAVLITILRYRSRGRSKNTSRRQCVCVTATRPPVDWEMVFYTAAKLCHVTVRPLEDRKTQRTCGSRVWHVWLRSNQTCFWILILLNWLHRCIVVNKIH